MSDRLTSFLRTVVPMGWSLLIGWLVEAGLPTAVTNALSGLGDQVTNLVIAAALYALLRYVEPHLPDWATRVLLGSARPPVYPSTEPNAQHTAA